MPDDAWANQRWIHERKTNLLDRMNGIACFSLDFFLCYYCFFVMLLRVEMV